MNKIVFSHSYFLRFDPKQWKLGQPYAPLGTLYAAALMRQHGYRVSIHDTMFAKTADDIIPTLDQEQPDFFVIYDDGFNYLTKMCLTNMREAAFEMIRHAKKRNCKVIVSSSDSTDHYEEYIHAGADFILLGEAELSLLELVNSLSNGALNIESIAGLAYRVNESITKTAPRKVMKELDDLPFPAWDLIDMEPYQNSWLKSAGYFSINMGTTRGCPFKCNWCAKPIYGNRYNTRSPENVVAELKMLKEKYKFDHIWFCDDIFGLKPGWVHEFANLVEKEKLPLRFKIQARADLLLQENYIKDLARAGCENIWMGAESGSQKILDAMDKGIQVEQVYAATALLKKNGIQPSFFIQFGYSGETWSDIRLTIKMINELLPTSIGISVSYPLPGTVFYERVKADLAQKSNWKDSDELAMMFRNNYPPVFYKQLHRYVHKTYRQHLAFDQIKRLLTFSGHIKAIHFKKAASFFYYTPAAMLSKMRLEKLQNAWS